MADRNRHTRKKHRGEPVLVGRNRSVHPGDDFYTFVNGLWIHKTKIPSYLSSYSVSDEIEDQINTELFSIINKAKHEIHTSSTSLNKKLLGTLAKSVDTLESSPANLQTLHTILSKIKAVKTMEDLGSMLGTLLLYQMPTLLECMILTSESNTKLYRLAISPGKLMLLDPSNYDTDTANKRHIQHVYKTTLHKLSKEFII
jgi:putative endopeptidase